MLEEASNYSILVIDDEEIIRNSIAAYLEDYQFKVFLAENGRAGLETFNKEKVDLVITDLQMPEVDGKRVLSKINEQNPEMPIIVISGTGRITDSIDAHRLGAWDYVLKPIDDMSVILIIIKKALERVKLKQDNISYQKNLEVLVEERTQKLQEVNYNLEGMNIRLRKLVDTTKSLTNIANSRQFGEELLSKFAEHMEAKGGSIYFLENKGLKLIHTLDPGHAAMFIPYPLNPTSILSKTISKRKPLILNQVKEDLSLSLSGWKGYKNESVISFPLLDGKGSVIAVITLHNKKNPPFIEQDKEMGSILASYSTEKLRAVRAGETLRESEERMDLAIKGTNAGLWDWKLDTNRFIINPRWAEILGQTVTSLLPLNNEKWLSFFHPEDVIDVKKNLNSHFSNNSTSFSCEARVKNKDGNWIWIYDSGRVVKRDKNGLPLRILGTRMDITKRKQAEKEKKELEEQLRRSQKLETIGTLAGGIAHDFNNILTPIIGFTELAIFTLEKDSPVKRNLNQVMEGAKRAKDLVEQILLFSKQVEKKRIPTSLHIIIKEALKLIRPSIPNTIEITKKIDADNDKILADATQMHQVIVNLCTNAWQAMELHDGKLTISTKQVTVDVYGSQKLNIPTGDYIKLSISDTGKGIKSEDLERIFEPFYTTKPIDKGTGLGLSVVHGIIENHEGVISVESIEGKGTTFTIFLPIVEMEEEKSQAEITTDFTGNERILVIDDDISVSHLLQQMLEKFGYRVETFNNSLAGLNAVKSAPDNYDLIISDLTMPHINGLDLAGLFYEVNKNIPILIITGNGAGVSTEHILSKNIKSILEKPLIMADLLEKVKKLSNKDVQTSVGENV